VRRNALALVLYAAVSFGFFGWRVLPHPGRTLIGSGQDPLIFIWSFAWWPHAIGTWTNPFFTHALFAPQGVNLAWTTSVPGLALAFTPVTLAFGPVVSYNLAALLLPALAAWTAFLLCRHLTRSTWASLVGGYLFGFSSYVLGHELQGHLNLIGVFLLPLVALAVLRYTEGEIDARGLTWRLAVAVALQLAISIEVALMMTLALAVALVLGALFAESVRPRLRSALKPLLAAYAGAAVLTAPLVVYLVKGFSRGSLSGAERSLTDLANVLLPTKTNAILGSSFKSVSANFNDTESALFLGLPTIAIIALFAWRAWRTPGARVLLAGLVIAFVAALGTALRIDGPRYMPLPWALARHIPALNNIRAPRFAVFVALAAAVIVALWTARTPGRIFRAPYVLPALAVAALLPAVSLADYRSQPERWPFFTNNLYRQCLSPNETLLVFPFGFGDDSMLWQAEAGYRFRLAEGYMYPLNPKAKPVSRFDDDPTVKYLDFYGDRGLPTMELLLAFAATHGVDRVVSVPSYGYPSASQMARFGPVEKIGGVLVSPACGRPSLRTHNLSSIVQDVKDHWDATIGYCSGTNYVELPNFLYPVGVLKGATHALMVKGTGLTCSAPAGYHRHGFATVGVPANTYPYYEP
jgi:hypothetical protein